MSVSKLLVSRGAGYHLDRTPEFHDLGKGKELNVLRQNLISESNTVPFLKKISQLLKIGQKKRNFEKNRGLSLLVAVTYALSKDSLSIYL